jgi:hypothetical protein
MEQFPADRNLTVGDGFLGRVLKHRARVIRAPGIVGRLEVDGVGRARAVSPLARAGIWLMAAGCPRSWRWLLSSYREARGCAAAARTPAAQLRMAASHGPGNPGHPVLT